MNLATLTTTGRAALVKAIIARPIHVAWGSGLEDWDAENANLPDLIGATTLVNELGRRLPTHVGFVIPDAIGDIVVPKGYGADGTVQEARYSRTETPTPFLYFLVNYNFEDASESVIREVGIFMDTECIEGLPPGQRYFLPADIADKGMLLAVQILPRINRSPAIRQVLDFVLPL